MLNVIYSTMEVFNRIVYIARDDLGITYLGSPLEDFEDLQDCFKGVSLVRDDNAFQDLSEQMREYEAGRRTDFDLPLNLIGTEFRLKVWNTLQSIPYGSVCTYTDIADIIAMPTAVRVVASAIGKNPIMILVPCHRVNGKDGKLHGFRGGLDLKVELQDLEAK